MRSTYSYATMAVTPATFEEIKGKLAAAGYQNQIENGGTTLDMNGIALEIEEEN